jgi:hypothetical protein
MEGGTARYAAYERHVCASTSVRHGFRQGSPRLGRRCQHSLPTTSPRGSRDTTYGRCTMAGRSAPSGKSPLCGTARLPWRALGLGSSALGGIAAAYYSHPLVGQAIVVCETASVMITIGTALFGSATTSERAFRLLRWLANRPEPDAPPAVITQGRRRSGRPQSRSQDRPDNRSDGRLTRSRRTTRG